MSHVVFTGAIALQVRAVASKALGAMVRGLGEGAFADLVPWLLENLHNKSRSVWGAIDPRGRVDWDRLGVHAGAVVMVCILRWARALACMH